MKLAIVMLLGLMLFAVPSGAYQILLDLDLDDDPTTINLNTEDDSALVRMILAPDGAGEWITTLEFGLGGTCWMCWEWYIFMYGTHCDLFDIWYPDPWLDHPLFSHSENGAATCIECCGNPGYHYIFMATAADGGFQLDAPIFIRDFWAWEVEHPVCEAPPPDLMAFTEACGGPCNAICLSGQYSAVQEETPASATWQDVKTLY